MKKSLTKGELAKLYYRRAVGLRAVKEEEKAVKDLEVADGLLEGKDGAISTELVLFFLLLLLFSLS